MADLFTILNRGYFPRETPPPFQTLTYAKAVAFPKLPLPIDFQSLQGCSSSLPLTHNLPRPGSLRRKLSIPNPVNFYQVAKIVSNSWADITAHCNQSQISLTTPHLGPPLGRAISGKNDLSEKPNHRARIRSTSKYLLTADISQFYNTLDASTVDSG